MKKIGLNELRDMFRDFYIKKEHYHRASYSLIPEDDQSLLIINSGMAPLKPYFSGTEKPPAKRMTTCQKCIRTGDIDNVGYTDRHGTFFEMLGSFSFGDYFKKESIIWGWEFLTKILNMPEECLWASIYEEDNEAYDIWKNIIKLPDEKIVSLGKEDNFWEIGIGPCGPCSEIYFDRGKEHGCEDPDCKPGCECDRFVEIWNHVFTQFNKDSDGNYTPLKHKNIDTGMGLERLACVMQNVDSIFDVDTIRYILDAVLLVSGKEYHFGKNKDDISIRIITDHLRSMVFMIGDGILPGNEGRGYVLRRLLRRAARHGRLLGIERGFLADLSMKVIDISEDAYPELSEKKNYIHRIISIEEDKFSHTLDQGNLLLDEEISNLKKKGKKVLDGQVVFKLYDTFGFPLELTEEILIENGCKVDKEGFEKLMDHQREMARTARKSSETEGWKESLHLLTDFEPTVFTGYKELQSKAVVIAILADNCLKNKLEKGESASLILKSTPFYAEGGGQVGDKGTIENQNFSADVFNVFAHKGIFLHEIKINAGTLHVKDLVEAKVHISRRHSAARNHTGTHLLHQALKEVLGNHVEQAGSYVTADNFRFDFTHYESVANQDLNHIENIVNEKIVRFLPVTAREMPIEDAKKAGALAQFGEKYGDVVRVISIGDFSRELCGGTHVDNTGQIGSFKIISESGIAAGVRRIEAVTGIAIQERLKHVEENIETISELLKVPAENLSVRISDLLEELKTSKKEIDLYRQGQLGSSVDEMLDKAKVIKGIKLVTGEFTDYDVDELRSLSDQLKGKTKAGVIVLASVKNEKVTFIASVTDDLLEKGYHAGNMIKKIAAAAGGGGGGKADMAQAGAKDPSKIRDAFDVAAEII